VADRNPNEAINKKDLDLIIQVNKKAIQIQTEVVDQNEEIINFLEENKKDHDFIVEKAENLDKINSLESKIDLILKKTEEFNKDIFKIQVMFASGLLGLIIQLIQAFIKK